MSQSPRILPQKATVLNAAVVFGVVLLVFGVISSVPAITYGQQGQPPVDPKKALLKSLVLPGWGHLSLGAAHQARGQWQLGTEIALWMGYAGFTLRSHRLEEQLQTQAATYAGIEIASRSQDLWIALGQYDNLSAYNEQQLLNRNWDQLYDDVPANRWDWQTRANRLDFESTRDTWNRTKQQLPAILSAMILNRLIAGISAYRRARSMQQDQETAMLNNDHASQQGYAVQVSVKPVGPGLAQHAGWSLQPVFQIRF